MLDSRALRTTLDSLREGLQIVSPEWRYLYVNEAVARHGRKSQEELLGKTMLECYPGIEETPLFQELSRCMAERCSAELENEFEYEDGMRAWFELRVEPCEVGLVILSLDITARKRLETEARRGQRLRALGQMAASVAHDLKNILNPLSLQTQLLKRRLDDHPRAASALDEMAKIITWGDRTVDRLRQASRQAPDPATTSATAVDAVVAEAVSLCRPRAQDRPQPVEVILEAGNPRALFLDRTELLNAVMNLIVNAIEASPDGGDVRVRTAETRGKVLIEVIDRGTGMSESEREQAFEPFFSTKGEAGTGLGLAMVYAFALRNHGETMIQTKEGDGTVVTLALPAER